VLLWARRGLIASTEVVGHREAGLRFTKAAVTAFRETYVTGGELSRDYGGGGTGEVTRHLQFLGVQAVSDRTMVKGTQTLFRRADLHADLLRQVSKGNKPSAQAVRGHGYQRVVRVSELIGKMWNACLSRQNNRFSDMSTGRVVQIVSGRRPGRTGAFHFHIQKASLDRLRQVKDAFVALVPAEGQYFLLLPLTHLPVRGGGAAGRGTSNHVSVGFDGSGKPLSLAEWAVSMADDGFQGVGP
jgi:hypothetical protein